MNLLSESLTIGLLLTLVFGSLCFYIYSRVSYVERRVGLMENILLDIKMNQDNQINHVLPTAPYNVSFQQVSVLPEKQEEVEQQQQQLPTIIETETSVIEEEAYTSVLNEAHGDTPKKEENYDTMTKDELLEVAKQKGLRVGNRPGREKLLQLLRKSEESTILESDS